VRNCETYIYGAPDLLIAGSPCQGFSFAGKQLNFNDPRSALFFEFVRFLNQAKKENPNIYFLLENVVMKKVYQDVISEALGVQPVLINSALVSAQNRRRLYWTNIPYFGLPADKGIYLKDILETEGIGSIKNRHERYERHEKAMCLDASYYKGEDNHGQRTITQEAVALTERRTEEAKAIRRESFKNGKDFSPRRGKELVERTDGKANCLTTGLTHEHTVCIQVGLAEDIKGHDKTRRVYSEKGKAPTLTACSGGNQEIKVALGAIQVGLATDIKGLATLYKENVKSTVQRKKFGLMAPDQDYEFYYRKLTVTECERLQTVPDGYTKALSATAKQISNTQAYKMLGNGWNIKTIVHLLTPLTMLDILG
jgi:site-specific DNA-cytosine methylase